MWELSVSQSESIWVFATPFTLSIGNPNIPKLPPLTFVVGLFQILRFAFIACCIFFDISANFGGKEPFKVILSPTEVDIRLPLKQTQKMLLKDFPFFTSKTSTAIIFNLKRLVVANTKNCYLILLGMNTRKTKSHFESKYEVLKWYHI